MSQTSPHIEHLLVSAIVRSGVCPLSAVMTPDTISTFTITVEVKDPRNLLLHAARLARGPHPDSKTSNNETDVTYIQSPGHELSFSTNDRSRMEGLDSTTTIGLQIRDPWLLILLLSEAGLVDSDEPHPAMTVAVAYQLVHHTVSRLVGFEALADTAHSPASLENLSPAASELVAKIGAGMSDSLLVAAELDRFLEKDHPPTYGPESVAEEVRAHFINRLGLRLADVLPSDASGLHERHEAWCEGCLFHGASPIASDGWKIEAWPSAASAKKAMLPIYTAFHSA